MTRAHRAVHPLIWALVLFVSGALIASAWGARPAPAPASLPDAAVAAVEEDG